MARCFLPACAIVDVAPQLSSLRRLELEAMQLSESAAGLAAATQLTHLSLVKCDLDADTVATLRESLSCLASAGHLVMKG